MPDDDDIVKLENAARRATKKDQQIAELEKKLDKEKDKRGEERFLVALGGFIALDVFAFPRMAPTGMVLLFLTQALFILVLGKRCGVEEVGEWIEWVKSLIRSDKADPQ